VLKVLVNSDVYSIANMSGLGPPGVWAAQKRLESWARAARERTSSASSGQSHNSTDSFGDDKSHSSPSVCILFYSTSIILKIYSFIGL
jgi:hypothetical protein